MSNIDWTMVVPAEDRTAPDPIMQTVSMTQARLALFDLHGIETDEQFFGLVNVLPEESRQHARVELATRAAVTDDNTLVAAVCDAKGWDKAELFKYAATL